MKSPEKENHSQQKSVDELSADTHNKQKSPKKEQHFIVDNSLQAYQEWLSLVEEEVRLLLKLGIKIKVNNGQVIDIIHKDKLTNDMRKKVLRISDRYLWILSKIKEEKFK